MLLLTSIGSTKPARHVSVNELARLSDSTHSGFRLQYEYEDKERHAHEDHGDGEAPVVCTYIKGSYPEDGLRGFGLDKNGEK